MLVNFFSLTQLTSSLVTVTRSHAFLWSLAVACCGTISGSLMAAECDDRPFCIGTPVDQKVYAAWDIDVKPDGHGLPPLPGDRIAYASSSSLHR